MKKGIFGNAFHIRGVFLIGIGIVWGVVSIIDVIKTLKYNYKFYIIEKHGDFTNVFLNIWDNLEDYSRIFFWFLVIGTMLGSFVVFVVSLGGGAE